MNSPVRIIGAGLAGTVLALTCYRRRIPFELHAAHLAGEASLASSGIINPVTGRRYVKTWMIETLTDHARDFYRWTENLFGQPFFHAEKIVRFLDHPEAKTAWDKRRLDIEYHPYISLLRHPELDSLNRPYGIITGVWRLDTLPWLSAAHLFLESNHLLHWHAERIDSTVFPNCNVVLATGAVNTHPMPGMIPNKGDALCVAMSDWKIPFILKDDIYVVPLRNGTYWIGSQYERWPVSDQPSEEQKSILLNKVKRMYSGNIEIHAHVSGIRPTTDDRRPLIGSNGIDLSLFHFNGMGTKGTSLAPYWADRLLDHIADGVSLPAEVLPTRFPVQHASGEA